MPPAAVAVDNLLLSTPQLTAEEFEKLRLLIYEKAGITLNDTKQQLVSSRLARRLRHHKLSSYNAYYEFVTKSDPSGAELRELINCITTNKTDFFRENHHFEFLKSTILADRINLAASGGPLQLRIWSAGCSTGEEPYTLAMTLLATLPNASRWKLQITATDIDTQVLATAARGVYNAETIAPVPDDMRRRFLMRGSGANEGRYRVHRELRELIEFKQLNFVEPRWPVEGPFDMIFCRNVMIYFDRDTQARIATRFAQLLVPGGYLFLGHSESLLGKSDQFEALRGTIYRRLASGSSVGETAVAPSRSIPSPGAATSTAGSRLTNKPIPSAPAVRRPAAGRTKVNIMIGGVHASGAGAAIRTILGSCVAACVYDPVARVGGMNHFMLPDGLEDTELPTRYGVNAMEVLINSVLKLGGERSRLLCKAFGAAHVLSAVGLSPEVPRKNARFIKEFLQREQLSLVSSRLGGSAPVEVVFHPDTGRALIRTVATVATDLAREEKEYDLETRRRMTTPAPESAVELF